MPFFAKLHTVIRRGSGSYVDGVWTPPTDGPTTTMLLDLQPAKGDDVERVRSDIGGQSLTALLVGYGGTTNPLTEGDILVYGGQRYVVISAPPPRDALSGDTGHVKYLFTRELEAG